MPTDTFFNGLALGEETEVFFGEGVSHVVKLVRVGRLRADGKRRMVYEIDGFRRALFVQDPNAVKTHSTIQEVEMADENNEKHVEIGRAHV